MSEVKNAWALCQTYGCQAYGKDAELRTAHDRIADLERQLVEARAALEPFAEVGSSEGTEDYPDDMKATLTIGRSTYYFLTLGDFRRAALSPQSPPSHDAGEQDDTPRQGQP